MANYNRVTLVGRLTRDVELRHVGPNNTAVTELGFVVNDRVKRGDEWVQKPTYVDVTFWGRQAEVASEYLKKGSQLLVEGRLKLDQWEKDGEKRSKLRVVGEKLQMLDSRASNANAEEAAFAGSGASEEAEAHVV